MKAFASHHGYQDSQLTLLNLCCLSCHALRLSDISTGNGQHILPRSWEGYPTDSSGCELNGPTMDAHRTWLGTYGFGSTELLPYYRDHKADTAPTLGLLDKLNTTHLAVVLLSFPGSSLPSLTR
jgi:hypothetical protein